MITCYVDEAPLGLFVISGATFPILSNAILTIEHGVPQNNSMQ